MTDPLPTGPAVPSAGGRYDFDRVVRILFTVAVVGALFWLVRYLADVLLPLAVAVLLAYLLNPLVTLLDSRFQNRTASVAVVFLAMLLIVLAGMLLIVPIAARQVSEFSTIIEAVRGDGEEAPTTSAVESALIWRERYLKFKEGQSTEIRLLLERGEEGIRGIDWAKLAATASAKVVPGIWGALSALVAFFVSLAGLVVILVYLAFLLIDYPVYAGRWREFLPPAYRQTIVEFSEEFADAMSRYFRGQFVIAVLTGALFTVGFWLIGLRLAVPLGMFIGACCMVPYFQVVGLVPALLLAVIRAIEHQTPGGSVNVWTSILLVLMVFALVQVIQDWVLTPRIMGKTTGLRPVVLIAGVFIWGKLLGFLGLVLAIPLTCIGLAYYRKFVLEPRATRSTAIAPPRVQDQPR